MEGSCSTGQSPQWAVVPVEEKEEEEEEEKSNSKMSFIPLPCMYKNVNKQPSRQLFLLIANHSYMFRFIPSLLQVAHNYALYVTVYRLERT
jgi:hypothetical protein